MWMILGSMHQRLPITTTPTGRFRATAGLLCMVAIPLYRTCCCLCRLNSSNSSYAYSNNSNSDFFGVPFAAATEKSKVDEVTAESPKHYPSGGRRTAKVAVLLRRLDGGAQEEKTRTDGGGSIEWPSAEVGTTDDYGGGVLMPGKGGARKGGAESGSEVAAGIAGDEPELSRRISEDEYRKQKQQSFRPPLPDEELLENFQPQTIRREVEKSLSHLPAEWFVKFPRSVWAKREAEAAKLAERIKSIADITLITSGVIAGSGLLVGITASGRMSLLPIITGLFTLALASPFLTAGGIMRGVAKKRKRDIMKSLRQRQQKLEETNSVGYDDLETAGVSRKERRSQQFDAQLKGLILGEEVQKSSHV